MTDQLQALIRQWRTRSVERMAEAMKHHSSHRGHWLGEAESMDRAADELERVLAMALQCVPEAHQSRICERGTSGCMVVHSAAFNTTPVRKHAGTGRPWSPLELFLLGAASTTGDPRYQDAAMLLHEKGGQ